MAWVFKELSLKKTIHQYSQERPIPENLSKAMHSRRLGSQFRLPQTVRIIQHRECTTNLLYRLRTLSFRAQGTKHQLQWLGHPMTPQRSSINISAVKTRHQLERVK